MVIDMIFVYTILAGFVNQSLCTTGRPYWVEVKNILGSKEIAILDDVYMEFHSNDDWLTPIRYLSGQSWDDYFSTGVGALIPMIYAVSSEQDLYGISVDAPELILPLMFYNMFILNGYKESINSPRLSLYLAEINNDYLKLTSTQYRGYLQMSHPLAAEFYLVALTYQYLMDEEMRIRFQSNSQDVPRRLTLCRNTINEVRKAMASKFRELNMIEIRQAKLEEFVNELPVIGDWTSGSIYALQRLGMEILIVVAIFGRPQTEPLQAMFDLLKGVGEIQIVLDPALFISTTKTGTRNWDLYGLMRGLQQYLKELFNEQRYAMGQAQHRTSTDEALEQATREQKNEMTHALRRTVNREYLELHALAEITDRVEGLRTKSNEEYIERLTLKQNNERVKALLRTLKQLFSKVKRRDSRSKTSATAIKQSDMDIN
jgi:hypothetical protein